MTSKSTIPNSKNFQWIICSFLCALHSQNLTEIALLALLAGNLGQGKEKDKNSFIASDKQNYVDKALYFSENINLLEEERNKLFNQVLFSRIFNSKQFGIDFSKCIYELFRKQNR